MTTAKGAADSGGGFLHWLLQDTMDGLRRRRAILGYLFLLPTLLGIFTFTAGPVFVSFGLSLFRWNIFKPPDYIELANYERLISDVRIAISFGNTLKFTVLAVATQVSIGLILAFDFVSVRNVSGLFFHSINFSKILCILSLTDVQ